MTARSLAIPFILVASLAGCGSEDPAPQTEAVAATVVVENYKFTPATVTIKPGQTVEWVFKQGVHDVVSGAKGADGSCIADGKFKSELLSTGTYRQTFDTAGSYAYFCTPHCAAPNNQVGTVVVQP